MQVPRLHAVYLSLLLAFLCYLLPWEGWGLVLRPDFALVVLLYWVLRTPHLCGLGTAWFTGLAVDAIVASTFGQHALVYGVTVYLMLLYHNRLSFFGSAQQSFFVVLLLLLSQVFMLILKLLEGSSVPALDTYFLASFTGVVLWVLACVTGMFTLAYRYTKELR